MESDNINVSQAKDINFVVLFPFLFELRRCGTILLLRRPPLAADEKAATCAVMVM